MFSKLSRKVSVLAQVRGTLIAVAAAGVLGLCVQAMAQPQSSYREPNSGTWPEIIPTVSTMNGWVTVEGRALNPGNRVVWRIPLTPAGAGRGVSVRNGYGTMFVSVGDQQFVIDTATGSAVALQSSQVMRLNPPSVYTPGGGVVPPGTYIGGGGTVNPSIGTMAALEMQMHGRGYAQVRVADDSLQRNQAAMGHLSQASDNLLVALAALDEVRRQRSNGNAIGRDVLIAENNVRKAKEDLVLAQRTAARILAMRVEMPTTAPAGTAATNIPQGLAGGSTGPVTGGGPAIVSAAPYGAPLSPREEIELAADNVLKLNTQLISAQKSLQRLQMMRATGEITPLDIARAQLAVETAQKQLNAANSRLEDLRRGKKPAVSAAPAEGAPEVNAAVFGRPEGAFSPSTMPKLPPEVNPAPVPVPLTYNERVAGARRDVTETASRLRAVEEDFRTAHALYSAGRLTQAGLNESASAVLDAMAMWEAANRKLEAIVASPSPGEAGSELPK